MKCGIWISSFLNFFQKHVGKISEEIKKCQKYWGIVFGFCISNRSKSSCRVFLWSMTGFRKKLVKLSNSCFTKPYPDQFGNILASHGINSMTPPPSKIPSKALKKSRRILIELQKNWKNWVYHFVKSSNFILAWH